MANQFSKVAVEFDKFLAQKNLFFDVTVIGGAALNILQISQRLTTDVDCLAPTIPDDIKKASLEFQITFPELGLIKDWLNNGPSSLVRDLPQGWPSRLTQGFKGTNLIINVLGRPDLLKTKLYAYCDRNNPDFEDLLLLKPTQEELLDSIAWVKERDGNPGWPANVDINFKILKEALYG